MILTRKELDASGCATPDCGHDHSVLFLLAPCHMNAGLAVSYVKASGTLKFECGVCERPVTEIAVADWRSLEDRGIKVS